MGVGPAALRASVGCRGMGRMGRRDLIGAPGTGSIRGPAQDTRTMTAAFPADSSRVIRLTLIGLLAFSVLQVCWWLVDQTHFAEGTTHQVRALYAADLSAARRMEAAGVAPDQIVATFPHIGREASGRMEITPAAAQELEASRRSHIK